jgi:putative addiction module CopG family antidote
MPIALPPELEKFARQQIENGTYHSIEEVLVEGVRSAVTRLQATMDSLSDEAEANGLTPEILQSILDDE